MYLVAVPIVQDLWTSALKHVEYYSEKEDDTIPTISLGVKNTERGKQSNSMRLRNWYKDL